MKKTISIILSLVILTFMALPVYAAGMEVKFTSSSSFKAGGTVTADKTQTCMSIMDDSSCTSDEYNAALERLHILLPSNALLRCGLCRTLRQRKKQILYRAQIN